MSPNMINCTKKILNKSLNAIFLLGCFIFISPKFCRHSITTEIRESVPNSTRDLHDKGWNNTRPAKQRKISFRSTSCLHFPADKLSLQKIIQLFIWASLDYAPWRGVQGNALDWQQPIWNSGPHQSRPPTATSKAKFYWWYLHFYWHTRTPAR